MEPVSVEFDVDLTNVERSLSNKDPLLSMFFGFLIFLDLDVAR